MDTTCDRDVKGLKLGLQMDAGWGLAVEPEVRAAVEAAARAFERAGAIVEPMPAFSTRAMIDGMDRFWRMRSWLDIAALPPERRDKVLPYIRAVGRASGARLTATEVFHGYSQMGAMRDAAVAACQPFDFVLSPVSPVPTLRRRVGEPDQRPAAAVRAHRLHAAVQHERAAGGVDQLRLHVDGPADRPADHRPPARRSGRAAGGAGVRADAPGAKALAVLLTPTLTSFAAPAGAQSARERPSTD